MKDNTGIVSKNDCLSEQIDREIKALSSNNASYAQQINEYMTFKGFLKDENAVFKELLSVVNTIKEMDTKGILAEEYFGKSPKALAGELLRQIPRQSIREIIKDYAKGVAFIYSINLLVAFAETGQFRLELWTFVISCLLVLAIVFCLMTFVPKAIKNGELSKGWAFFLGLVTYIILKVILKMSREIGEFGIYLDFPEVIDWLFVGVVSLGSVVLVVKYSRFRLLPLPIMGFLLTGVIKKLVLHGFLSGQLWEMWLPMSLQIISVICFFLGLRFLEKGD